MADTIKDEEKQTQGSTINKTLLAGFVPTSIKQFADNFPESRQFKAPMRQPYVTATLFADISGFTKTSVALSKFGPYGAWALSDCLNRYMTLMIREVQKQGGDIIKFAGDAMIAIWPQDEDLLIPPVPEIPNLELYHTSEKYKEHVIKAFGKEPEEADFTDPEREKKLRIALEDFWQKDKEEKLRKQTENLPNVTQRVIGCCCEIQKSCRMFRKPYRDVDVELGVKLGVGCGRVDMLHLGGVYKRLEFLVCGPGLQQAFRCEEDAVAGDILCSEDVWANIKKAGAEIEGTQNKPSEKDGVANYHVKHMRLNCVKRRVAKVDLNDVVLNRVADYVPKSVLPHLSIAQGEKWANELRECTILFVSLGYNLKDFNGDDNGETLEEIHQLIQVIQTAVYNYEGSLNKFLSDDKGSTLIAVFGLFPVSHIDDKARAVLAGLRLKSDLDKLNYQCWIGITSGMVFSGLCGHITQQREFSVIGVHVNLAARLMAEAKYWKKKHEHEYKGVSPHILVSEAVKKAAEGEARLTFKTLDNVPFVKCKGFEKRQRVFKPRFLQNYKNRVRQQLDSYQVEFVSHFEDDIKRVKENVMEMRNNGHGCTVMVEGMAGLGVAHFKRRLKGELVAGLGVTKWAFAAGVADPFHTYQPKGASTPVWEQIFENLRELKGYQQGDRDLFQKYKSYVRMRRPDIANLMSLVTSTLHFSIMRDERYFQEFTKEQEMVAGMDLLCLFLEMIAHSQPIVVMVYRAEHLQGWDWHLCRRLATLIKHKLIMNVSLIISCAPVDNKCYTPLYPHPTFVPQFKMLKREVKANNLLINPQVWSLNNTRDYIKKWVTTKMGFRGEELEVCDLIVNSVHERCGGRPEFCELFVTSLHDEQDCFYLDRSEKKVLFEKEVENRLHHDIGNHFAVPDMIKCLVIAHFDRIEVEKQMVLKVASVLCIGQGVGCLIFDREMLEEVHPINHYVQRIDNDIRALVDLGYINEVSSNYNDGDDPPNMGGSPLYDYTEVMPDIKYLLIDSSQLGVPYMHGKMTKTKTGTNSEKREFVFKNNVLYWWNTNQNIEVDPKPKGSIFFDPRYLHNPEARNPQLTYAIGVKMQNAKMIIVQTTNQAYEFRTQHKAEASGWHNLFQKTMESFQDTNQEEYQARARTVSSVAGASSNADTMLFNLKTKSTLDKFNRNSNRGKEQSRLSLLQSLQTNYMCAVTLTEELSNASGKKSIEIQIIPEESTPESVITAVLQQSVGETSDVQGFHLQIPKSNWPLYGSTKMWDIRSVKNYLNSNELPSFLLIKSEEEKRYSRMPNNAGSTVVITVKMPSNDNHLSSMKQNINFNTTRVHNIIDKCIQRLSRGCKQRKNAIQEKLEELIKFDFFAKFSEVDRGKVKHYVLRMMAHYDPEGENIELFDEIHKELTNQFPINEDSARAFMKLLTSDLKNAPEGANDRFRKDNFSQDACDWMLRLIGTDMHLFGKGLIAEDDSVRDAYDQNNGTLSFQLLKIKPAARKELESGKGSLKMYRFYAFSYGFMRDIIYKQMLHPQRKSIHERCAQHLQRKLDGAERGSVLQILMHRHDSISQKHLTG